MRLSKSWNPEQWTFGLQVSREEDRSPVVVLDFFHWTFLWEARDDYDDLSAWDEGWTKVWPRG